MNESDVVQTEGRDRHGTEPADGIAGREGAPRWRWGVVLIAASAALVLVAVAAFAFGRLSTLVETTPGDTSAEAGFARDMQVHHQQGAELATLIRDRSEDPDLLLLAYDIAATQTQQAGQMYGWLRAWGLPQAGAEPSMAWMMQPAAGNSMPSHASMDDPGEPMAMPGLATPEQITRLRAATGVDAERIFLELMITHHRGAVEMADAVLARSSNTVVVELAQSIIQSQTAEMKVLERMLDERG